MEVDVIIQDQPEEWKVSVIEDKSFAKEEPQQDDPSNKKNGDQGDPLAKETPRSFPTANKNESSVTPIDPKLGDKRNKSEKPQRQKDNNILNFSYKERKLGIFLGNGA